MQAHARKAAHKPLCGAGCPPHFYYPGELEERMDEIVTIISNVGFPIACAIAMFLQMEKEREAHKEESEKWVEAINKNTSVIATLTEVIKNGNGNN